MSDSAKYTQTLRSSGTDYTIYSLDTLKDQHNIDRLPYSIKILLENIMRHQDGVDITEDDIQAICEWDPKAKPSREIAFTPARVLLQDFTGVPAVVDLAAMRDAMVELGGQTSQINPLAPAELVIDHSVQVDSFGNPKSLEINTEREYERNKERYEFLKWGQGAFDNFKVVPPESGIVHQVNLEYLARGVFGTEKDGQKFAYPDTLVGTDSHTTMINGLGVVGWGVGGIEAEAAMLGQPISMLIPEVVGFKLTGRLPEGVTATDLVLTIVEMLREHGVVGKFVEFFGDGLQDLPLADRATIANMAPEYGATIGVFPIDNETLRYLEMSGRDDAQIKLVEDYAKAQGLWRDDSKEAEYSAVLELDMSQVKPSIAGPKRPQDRIELDHAKSQFQKDFVKIAGREEKKEAPVANKDYAMKDGNIVIAAITSCTNTSNPAVMLAAGLLARNAAAKGLKVKPWVKTSLAPGSKVVTNYLEKAELLDDLEKLGFYVVGYGCTTCIGNSGPIDENLSQTIRDNDLVATSVLSGNRNFEGRIHPDVKMNYLASPPLVVAYAIAGSMDHDLINEPLGEDSEGNPVYLRDIWPSTHEVADTIASSLDENMFKRSYEDVFAGDKHWQAIQTSGGERFDWQDDSTYIRRPPFFEGIGETESTIQDIKSARVLAKLGDSVTTDHISPAGAIAPDSPAGQYLKAQGVDPRDFNSYGSRRGNHEVMMRGTFANIRLKNELADGKEGGWTKLLPEGEIMPIFDAAMQYKQRGEPLVVIAGKEYGTGSSRDWAAKGTNLLGVKAVLAESFERIHRSNLVGMGVLPLQFKAGVNAQSLGLTGYERYDITGLEEGGKTVQVTATDDNGQQKTFEAMVRIDTPKEWQYYKNGGILRYVLKELAA